MRILITGAKGYLGKRLVSAYKDKHTVYAASHENMDFTDERKVQTVFADFRPEIVLHCGAVSDVEACSREPQKSLKINVLGTQNIARACRQSGAKMIFCSSDQVYIESLTEKNRAGFYLPHREEEKPKPLPIYGQHKLLAEQSSMNENPDTVVLRLTLLYDVPDESEKDKGKGMFAENLRIALENNMPQTVYKHTSRGITDCREVVSNMEKAWDLPPGIYNFGSSNTGTLYDTVRKVFAHFGKEGLVSGREDGDMRNLLIDTQKIERAGIVFSDTVSGLCRYMKSEPK